MVDAIHLRQLVQYNTRNHNVVGYVDLWNGEDVDTVAKEGLIIMVMGLRGRWKAPVAYYVTAGVSAETQKKLITATLGTLSDCGLVVHGLTTDRRTTYVAMAKLLGCQLDLSEPLKPLPESEHKIHVIFDAYHMIKLVRNLLHTYGTFQSPSGLIKWSTF